MKTFEEFLNEGVELEHGVTLHKDKSYNHTFSHNGEMKKGVKHDVHFNGEKIGHMTTYSHGHHKKLSSNSRLIGSTTYKIHHTTTYTHPEGKKKEFVRSDSGSSKEYLANVMAHTHQRIMNKS